MNGTFQWRIEDFQPLFWRQLSSKSADLELVGFSFDQVLPEKMSMMEFYSSTGTEENLSLQDMIEYDIKSIPSGDQWRAQTPSSEILMPLTV